MSVYMRCLTCKKHWSVCLNCPKCDSTDTVVSGDIHLYRLLGIDAYIAKIVMSGKMFLLIKKSSGQSWVEIKPEDFAFESVIDISGDEFLPSGKRLWTCSDCGCEQSASTWTPGLVQCYQCDRIYNLIGYEIRSDPEPE